MQRLGQPNIFSPPLLPLPPRLPLPPPLLLSGGGLRGAGRCWCCSRRACSPRRPSACSRRRCGRTSRRSRGPAPALAQGRALSQVSIEHNRRNTSALRSRLSRRRPHLAGPGPDPRGLRRGGGLAVQLRRAARRTARSPPPARPPARRRLAAPPPPRQVAGFAADKMGQMLAEQLKYQVKEEKNMRADTV